jgi:cell division protein FtsZ
MGDAQVSLMDAFRSADEVLLNGVQGITDLITTPGLINVDFADVKGIMSGAGTALMGIGSSRGDGRALKAAEIAINSPLLEASMEGAQGVLMSIAGGSDLGLFEINEAASLVQDAAHADANIIFGTVIDEGMKDTVKVTVIATGFDQPVEKVTAAPAPAAPAEEPPRVAARKTPAPFPVPQQTPPYLFEGRGGGPVWESSAACDKQWEPFETPAFIRRTKHSTMRKTPHDVS